MNTYACSSLITTISKSRILKPINEYDFVGKEKCPKEVMDKIDKELIEKFTKKFDILPKLLYIIYNKGYYNPFVDQRP